MSQAKQPISAKQLNKAEAGQAVRKQQVPELLPMWGQNPAVMRRVLNDPRSMNAAKIAHLQRTIGNQALGQWKTNLPSIPNSRNEVSDKSLNPVLGEAIPAVANSANTVQSLTSEGAQSSTLLENRRPATKYHAVSQVQRDEDNSDKKAWYEKAGDWALGAIGGEFVDEQTFGQIGVDFVISVIPILDQISDVRDLVANIYRIGFKGEHSKIMRWISLVFTLIGCIPEVGSVIKSLSKMAIRGIGNVLEHIGDILRLISKILPGQITNPWHLQDYIRKNWPRFASFATQQWNWLLSQGGRLVNRLPDFAGIRKLALAKLNNLAKISSGWFPRALEHVRALLDDALEKVRAFFRKSEADGSQTTTVLDGGTRNATTPKLEEIPGIGQTTSPRAGHPRVAGGKSGNSSSRPVPDAGTDSLSPRADVRSIPSNVRARSGVDVIIETNPLNHVLKAHTIENFDPVARAAEIASYPPTHLTTLFQQGTITNSRELFTLIRQALQGSAGRNVVAGVNNRIVLTLRNVRMEVWVGPVSGGGMRLNSIYPIASSGRNLTAAQIRAYAVQIGNGTRTLDQIRAEVARLLH